MNKRQIASELVKIAKSLVAAGNPEAYQKLLKEIQGGTAVLTAQDIHKDVPTLHNFAGKYHDSVNHHGDGMFAGKTEHGMFSFDAGGAMTRTGDVSWTNLYADDAVLKDLGYDLKKVEKALNELISLAGDVKVAGYEDDEDDMDSFDPDEEDERNEMFQNPGSNSALRRETPGNRRNRPCPNCHKPNRLTPKDVQQGYQCDECADRDEGRGGY